MYGAPDRAATPRAPSSGGEGLEVSRDGIRMPGEEEVLTYRGGVRFGALNSTWPFGRLLVTREEASLKSPFRTYVLRRNEVSAISRFGRVPLLAHGIRFHHGRADLPDPIVFWCIRPSREEVWRKLADLGYPLCST